MLLSALSAKVEEHLPIWRVQVLCEGQPNDRFVGVLVLDLSGTLFASDWLHLFFFLSLMFMQLIVLLDRRESERLLQLL